MAIYLLDTNVLVALGWPTHIHFEAAKHWLSTLGSDIWVTCPITECGFVRISSNPKCFPEATAPELAIELLRQLVKVGHHDFWEDSISLRNVGHLDGISIRGHQQITDAYLLALCIERGARLATFDRGLTALARPDQQRQHIHLIQE